MGKIDQEASILDHPRDFPCLHVLVFPIVAVIITRVQSRARVHRASQHLGGVSARFTAFHAFGDQYCADDPTFQTVAKVYKVVPGVLRQIKKIADPWPNVDAGSGALLYRYGMTEFSYYTVLFSVSRALGITSQAIVARGYGLPITRPKSVPTSWVKGQIG